MVGLLVVVLAYMYIYTSNGGEFWIERIKYVIYTDFMVFLPSKLVRSKKVPALSFNVADCPCLVSHARFEVRYRGQHVQKNIA